MKLDVAHRVGRPGRGGAAVVRGPGLGGGGHARRPVLLPALAVVGIDGIRGAVERDHRHRPAGRAVRRELEAAHRSDGREHGRGVAAEHARHARSAREARDVDAGHVQADTLGEEGRQAREEAEVAHRVGGDALATDKRLPGDVPVEARHPEEVDRDRAVGIRDHEPLGVGGRVHARELLLLGSVRPTPVEIEDEGGRRGPRVVERHVQANASLCTVDLQGERRAPRCYRLAAAGAPRCMRARRRGRFGARRDAERQEQTDEGRAGGGRC